MMTKEAIIIGGGNSIKNVNIDVLKTLCSSKFTILTNYAFKYFDGTLLICTDDQFYKPTQEPRTNPDYYDELSKLPLIIAPIIYSFPKIKHPNTILVKCSSSTYHRENGLTEGFFTGNLTGIFALSIASYLMNYEGIIFLCYDKDTEVFTNRGWKYFKDLDKTELILTRKSNGITEWCPILNYFEYDYNGVMKHIKARGIDLLITPNHNQCLLPRCQHNCKYCGSKSNCDEGYIFKSINELTTSNQIIPKDFIWEGKQEDWFILSDRIKIKMNDWVRFFGLYISEGCCLLRKDKVPSTIIIYQNHSEDKDNFIESILKQLPFKYSWHKRGWEVYSRDLVSYLRLFGNSNNKYIPLKIKQLNKSQLQLLLESLIFGDGNINKKNGIIFYTTISEQLANDVQEIFYKCGYTAGIYKRAGRKCKINMKPNNIGKNIYCIYTNTKSSSKRIIAGNLIVRNNIHDEFYKDKVYDITVKNHTLWVRRNKVCVWSGNCGFDWSMRKKEEIDPKKYNSYSSLETHYYNDIKHRGTGYVGYYENHNPNAAFKHFQEPKLKIYNVSLNSNINSFEKIPYEKMFDLLSPETINQEELRNNIYIKLQGGLNKG